MLFPNLYQSLLLTLFHLTLQVSASPIDKIESSTSSGPIVQLDYGSFQGATSSQYNLTYYRKIPFAASPAGKNRFRAPQPPAVVENGTIYDTDQAFDMCPQRAVNGSEDCLYLGIYSRPWDRVKGMPLRPVLLTFYGGGFIRGDASFTIPPSGFPVLNVSQQNDYVVVYSNYRINVFGFLPGSKIQQHPDVDLNPGLLDQQAALKWIQKYIAQFGGDAKNVTIWGQSAGGGSVVAQTIATGNNGKNLFIKAISSSPFWLKTARYDSPWAENLYAQTVQDVGCAGVEDEIACLKAVDVQKLRDSALKLSKSQEYTTSSFAWGPVIDDDFLAQDLSDVVSKGTLNADAVLTSYNLHEGENFIPPGFANETTGHDGFNSSSASFDAWLKGFLPDFQDADLANVKVHYPASGEAEQLRWNTTYERAGMIYRDLVLTCPAYWLANKADNGWLMEYTISPAKHASDVQYWNTINPIQTSDPLTYQGYAGALASFVQTGDPNAHKVTNESILGVPNIRHGKEFLITADGLHQGEIAELEDRCKFWLDVAKRVPI